jgi:DNA-binding transcriptional MerR regulator
MAQEKIFRREELLHDLQIQGEQLDAWEKRGLVPNHLPAGGGAPFYTEVHRDQAQQVRDLAALGYELDAIEKIVKKVGLPGDEGRDGRGGEGDWLTVGQLASRTGLNSRTIKYWEERGIISPDARSAGGFRLYRERTVEFCRLVLDLQLFGFTLDEIKQGADLLRDFFAMAEDRSPLDPGERVQRLEAIKENIAILQERMGALKQGIGRWEGLLRKRGKQIDRMLEKTRAGAAAGKSSGSRSKGKAKSGSSGKGKKEGGTKKGPEGR